MFAGAVREAVFGSPAVIRRVNAEFIPVSVGASRLHQPAEGPESRILLAAGRSAPAPQGLAVLNGEGQVLAWTLMFDNDAKVHAFLDETLREFRAHPDGARPFAVRSFQRYPSQPRAERAAEPAVKPLPRDHGAAGCPAERRLTAGTLEVKVVGRLLDAQGNPVTQAVNQEQYAQDRFTVPPDLQEQVAAAVSAAGAKRVRLPEELARLCASYAYLGQLDVRPIANPAGGQTALTRCELWATPGSARGLVRLDGATEVTAVPGPRPDGADFRHTVRLAWEGFAQVEGSRMKRLVLVGRGDEALRWSSGGPADGQPVVARLPAGRPFDVRGPVRYGLIGTPFAGRITTAGEADTPADGLPPLHELLGPVFLVALPAARAELKLTAEQGARLAPVLAETRKAVRALFSGDPGARPDLPQLLQGARQREEGRLRAALNGILTREQADRLRQMELQQQGAFALGDPAVSGALRMEDGQQMHLQRLFQETQWRFEAVQRQASGPGGPREMQERMLQVRREQETRLLSVLSPDQLRRWKSLLGKPFSPGAAP